MAGIFARCPWCKGHGRSDNGFGRNSAGPCLFCPGEREKYERRQVAYAQETFERTGDYIDPAFDRYIGQVEYYDLKTEKVYSLRPEISQVEEQVM